MFVSKARQVIPSLIVGSHAARHVVSDRQRVIGMIGDGADWRTRSSRVTLASSHP
ncbi:MAG TPA: hypothetical protein VG742_12885 [Dongiaceae bacterium]|nr:hypothetical protein [Dongiaceae bacterium]